MATGVHYANNRIYIIPDICRNFSIVLNTFAYQMKRDSPLRSGNSDTFLKVVNANSEKIIAGMKYLINENLFLRTDDSYAELNTAFESLKYKKSNFKNKR